MPVIRFTPQGPTDRVIAGSQMVIPDDPPFRWESYWSPLINDPPDRLPLNPISLVPVLYDTGMMDMSSRQFSARVIPMGVGRGTRANACICTPCGAVIAVNPNSFPFANNNDIGQSTVRFLMQGYTLDDVGVQLPGCRVVCLETARMQKDGQPVVAEVVSSTEIGFEGLFFFQVPLNTAYQIVGYHPDSPDSAGATRNDVVPEPVNNEFVFDFVP